MTTAQRREKEQAIQFFKAIASGEVEGFRIRRIKTIKVGSITFIIP